MRMSNYRKKMTNEENTTYEKNQIKKENDLTKKMMNTKLCLQLNERRKQQMFLAD